MASTQTQIQTGDITISAALYDWIKDFPLLLLALHGAVIKHQRGHWGLVDPIEAGLNDLGRYREDASLSAEESLQHRGPLMSLWNVGELIISITTNPERTGTRIALHS